MYHIAESMLRTTFTAVRWCQTNLATWLIYIVSSLIKPKRKTVKATPDCKVREKKATARIELSYGRGRSQSVLDQCNMSPNVSSVFDIDD